MNAHPELARQLSWLVNHSWQAGVLVLLVLAVQRLFRRRLASRWRFALWWIVLARLLVPFSPQSAVSLFNAFHPALRLEAPRPAAPVPPTMPAANHFIQASPRVVSPAPGELPQMENGAATRPEPIPATSGAALPKDSSRPDEILIPALAGLWLAGVLILSGVVVAQWVRFHRKLARTLAPAGANLRTLLEDCRHEFGLSRRVELLETGAVQSPALFGLLRLRLLLPRGFGSRFTGRELRYVFLHELAHVKRGDPWLNWLVTGLQILHWFNPLLWLGFARLRADRELACDELALLRAGDSVGTAYGETVVKLLEHLSRPAVVPGLVGILEDKRQMRRRIAMIANFRRPGRWSLLAALLLLAAMAAVTLTDAQTGKPVSPIDRTGASVAPKRRPDLTGMVTGKGGVPLPVPATVFIATAAPRTGTSTLCPSCYFDCGKRARTDAQGHFKIESLDPQLTFRILAVAKGYKPKFVSQVDPAKAPVKVELEPIESAAAAPDRSLHGRVVDSQGKPVAGAVVEMQGIESRDGGGSWGALPGIDPLAVTDGNGEFLITAQKPFEMMTVEVEARTYANKTFNKLASGAARHDLVVTEGATLTGRVLFKGKPLGGVSVGLSGVDRTAGNFLGHFEVGTDRLGRFTFVNLPPDGDFQIYTRMERTKEFGAVPPRQIHTGKDGQTTEAGDLIVGPAHRLAGRVILADGRPLPAKTRLLVSRETAWDGMQIVLGRDGSFDTPGVPSETISLSVRVKGYHVSAQNQSVDRMNPFQLVGRVDHDITNLVFLLEPGPDLPPDFNNPVPDYDQPRYRPLHGAEGVPDHSREWTVSGRAVDGETKQPVEHFWVVSGQTDDFNRTSWNSLEAFNGSNGTYLAYVDKRMSQPLLKAEADGYLPEVVNLAPRDATNVDFTLKKGNGPAGTVVAPTGEPVAGASVVMMGDGYNQAGFNYDGNLTAYGNQANQGRTGANGRFAFKPVWGVKFVAAASSNGFTSVSVESLATNPIIRLELFGRITGTLRRPTGPGTNEDLDVAFMDDTVNGVPRINLSNHAVTDAQGRFKFDRVPPGRLRISYRVPLSNHGAWRNETLKDVELRPGQNLVVSIAAGQRASPETLNTYRQPPMPKPIPGEQLKGIVLSPDGKPAADAEVALSLPSGPFYLALGHGTLAASGLREKGLLVNTDVSGNFNLPVYEKAQSVVAVNEDGFAQVSLDQLKSSPQIRLQKWGRIEGTLRVGHHPGTNQLVTLGPSLPRWTRMSVPVPGQTNGVQEITNSRPVVVPLTYDFNTFQTRTDEKGWFAFSFVPPGGQTINRLISTGKGSWSSSQLATVEVGPGETMVTNVGGTGRTVVGKLKFEEAAPADFKNGRAILSTPTSRLMAKLWQLKTDEERKAFYESEEYQSAMEHRWSCSAAVTADGSFQAEDVPPGNYELQFQENGQNAKTHMFTMQMFASAREVTVPKARDQNDDSAVDLGNIELKKLNLPVPGSKSGP
jgi:beta-lactamase regulating signal transducer with metallopeptidase domain/uncharacterized GH25 family protein